MDRMKTNRLGMSLAAAGLALGVVAAPALRGEEPGRLGRIFRLGGTSRPSDTPTVGKAAAAEKPEAANRSTGVPGSVAIPFTATPPAFSPLPSTPTNSSAGSRIKPQARITHAITEADPLITRVSIGRSDDGKQFCMFLQIYADGTVLDGEGVHRVGADLLRPIAEVLQSGQLTQVKGYCGGPAADFIEQVQLVAYDRYRGKIRATSIAFSGNPQGCDASVRQVNAAIDAIQTKISGPPVSSPPGSSGTGTSPASASFGSAAPTPPIVPTDSKPIGLTPAS